MSATVPKAVLYYSPDSTWSTSVLLALEEKGYGDDELDLKVVDLSKGENFAVSFLRLSPKATVPTLVVPFRDSVSDDAETRYKALTDTKAIINLLEQSRSPMSTSRTTSTAPAPSLAPATVAFSVTSNALLDILHADEVSPEDLKLVNARDSASLKVLAKTAVPLLEGRKQALGECISDAEAGKVQASEKVKKFWQDKQSETDQLLAVLLAADKEEAALDSTEQTRRAEFFAKAKKVWEVAVKGAVGKLNKEMIGPYALGDQLSVVDLSLAPWLRTVVMLAGGSAEQDGSTVIGKLEKHLGGDLVLPKDFQDADSRKDGAATSKLAAYWDAMRERASWKKCIELSIGLLSPPRRTMASSAPRIEDYDSSSSTDSGDTVRTYKPSKPRPGSPSPRSSFLLPSVVQSGRSSISSSTTSTPLPSRSASPLPQFRHSTASSSTSDTDSETTSPLLRANAHRRSWWSDDSRKWWTMSRRRRRRQGRIVTSLKKWSRWILRHPFFPRQPITIILTLILLSVFAIFVTLLLMYILNPDKDPLPWRAYCSATPPFPPPEIDALPPRRHVRSRNGAGDGDGGLGTSRTIVRFVMGEPRKDQERRVRLEMETYNDIIILPIQENMNSGKTHTFFSWAALNAWVPPVYKETGAKPHTFSYSSRKFPAPPLAPHDPIQAHQDRASGQPLPWVRPDYVIKVDDDSFVMLAELEARLRVELFADANKSAGAAPSHTTDLSSHPTLSHKETTSTLSPYVPAHSSSADPLIYWGYLVTNRLHRFMAGELYALSWSIVDWVSKDPAIKLLTHGAEDKQTAKWMKIRGDEIRWVSERCWIYNHPRSGTVYTHGFLFPSEATRVKSNLVPYPDKALQDVLNSSLVPGGTPTPSDWAYSSVSTFGVRYAPPIPDLTIMQSVEALVEGSEMSTLREGSPKTPEYAWARREGRKTRYQGRRVGGTVVVHFIKKNMWYLETALALLEGDELTGTEEQQPHDFYRVGFSDPGTRIVVAEPEPVTTDLLDSASPPVEEPSAST
ncbi:Glycosyltransferase family 31 protein [Mycena sanguinolenta]|uniref:Glycosyltransferase family 31 protein n=1 Tax=Mycena sanguinolenta TaxID=230812 RepID=A0A8H7CKH2_9AGAR|nr:Glycosyltransferase family 31 protein [Mycena sanguinolenta]